MPFQFTEKRKFPRHDFFGSIRYAVEGNDGTVYKGVTIDISRSGLRLYVNESLTEGQRINFITKLPVKSRTAILCWIRKLYDVYEAGVKFV